MNLTKDNKDLFHCYFRINHKNKNELMPSKLISKIQNYLLFSLGDNDVNKSNLIINNFLTKILYSKGNTFFSITNNLTYTFDRANLDIRKKSDKYIEDLLQNKREIYSSEILTLSLDMIKKIGTIFFYGCTKLSLYKIKDEDGLKNNVSAARTSEINVINDYNQYCYEHDIEPGQISKETFWDLKFKKYNYIIPPEYIFLENLFNHINTISIDFNWGETFTEEDLTLLTVIMININYIFTNLKGFNIEFKNYSLLQQLYEIYEDKLKENELKLGNLLNFTNYDLELKMKN